MEFLFSVLVMVIILGLVYWIVTLLPLPEPFKQIAIVIFGMAPAFPVFHHYRD